MQHSSPISVDRIHASSIDELRVLRSKIADTAQGYVLRRDLEGSTPALEQLIGAHMALLSVVETTYHLRVGRLDPVHGGRAPEAADDDADLHPSIILIPGVDCPHEVASQPELFA